MSDLDFGPRRGLEFEKVAKSAIEENDSWSARTSAYDDYVRKVDCTATCPEGRDVDIQFSLNPKSKRQREKLAQRAIVNITESDMQDIHDALCASCPLRAACDHHSDKKAEA